MSSSRCRAPRATVLSVAVSALTSVAFLARRAAVPVVPAVVAVLLGAGASPAGALQPLPLPVPPPAVAPAASSAYVAPVQGTVTDPFRPPPTPYAPGNRGVDYATAQGAPVVAPADGEVVFAGQVGGALHVVVLHPDGIRTTMGFLASIAVHRGQAVRQGDVVGTSTGAVHFGARVGEEYIDPLGLLADGPPRVLLVADDDRRPVAEGRERVAVRRAVAGSSLLGRGSGLLTGLVRRGSRRALGVAGAAAGAAAPVAGGAVRLVRGVALPAGLPAGLPARSPLRLLGPAGTVVRALTAARAVVRAVRSGRGPCTAAAVPEPVLSERRIAVLVPGLDSNLHSGFAHALDTRRLGYAPADTEVFSYRGGAQPYEGDETTDDLHLVAARLRQFLRARAALAPGVPIDVIAHSQGGLVTRAALALPVRPGEPPLPPIAHVVTLSSPHGGAPLAGVATALRQRPLARGLVWLHDALLDGFEARGDSIPQLAPGSDFQDELARGHFPDGTQVRTIGARYDIVVPSPGAGTAARPDVVVDPGGPLHAHSDVAASPAGRREVALAVNDLPPGCEGRADRLADALAGHAIRGIETVLRDALRPRAPWG